MASAILGEDNLARKTKSTTSTTSDLPKNWRDLPGLVNDPLIDEDAQVAILDRVDDTGAASLGDLMAVLPEHKQPAKAILRLVNLGVLAVEPGLIDAHSLLHRAVERPRAIGKDVEGEGGVPAPAQSGGKLHRLPFSRPQPEIFFASWSDRKAFRKEPALRQGGIYLALYCNCAYSGWSSILCDRLAYSNHLLQHGIPDLVIAAVDRNNVLTDEQMRVAERLLARIVQKDGVLALANNTLPAGDLVDVAGYAKAERFVRDMVSAVRAAGLAFTAPAVKPSAKQAAAEPMPQYADTGARHYSLHACGVHATAQVQAGKWVVQTGSQVRNELRPSAGSGAAQQRQELFHDGALVNNGSHFLLTRDVAFDTAASAARFVVGTGYSGKIWRPLPQQQPSGGDLTL